MSGKSTTHQWAQTSDESGEIKASHLVTTAANTKEVTVFGFDGCAIRCISTCSISTNTFEGLFFFFASRLCRKLCFGRRRLHTTDAC